jgi:hypothetical protein
MANLPQLILEELSPDDAAAALSWWARISESSRAELLLLSDPRADSCSFALTDAESGPSMWADLPIQVNQKLLADPDEPDVDWAGDYFEYRLLNPERWPIPLYEARTFHIGGFAPSLTARRQTGDVAPFDSRQHPGTPLRPSGAALWFSANALGPGSWLASNCHYAVTESGVVAEPNAAPDPRP